MVVLAGRIDKLAPEAPTLTEQAIQAVRNAIREGALVPGELYSAYRLAEDLGVSRSPVRDALLRLEETGIIKFERNRGFRILMPGPRELAEIFAVRVALEIPAARSAARNLTDEAAADLLRERDAMRAAAEQGDELDFMLHDQRLHAVLLRTAGNRYALDIVAAIRDATRLVGASTVGDSRSLTEIYEEHQPIIAALLARDEAAAADAMRRHLLHTGELLFARALQRSETPEEDAGHWERLVAGAV